MWANKEHIQNYAPNLQAQQNIINKWRNCVSNIYATATSLFKGLCTPLPANCLPECRSQYITQTMNKRNLDIQAICESFFIFLFWQVTPNFNECMKLWTQLRCTRWTCQKSCVGNAAGKCACFLIARSSSLFLLKYFKACKCWMYRGFTQ